MGDIAKRIFCQNCNKFMEFERNVIAEGITENGILYCTTRPKESYIIDENYTPSQELMQKNFIDKTLTYIPKFGKFEIESFIATELFNAIFTTKRLSNLLNTSIMLNDFLSDTIHVQSKRIKESILPLFDIKKVGSVYKCTFLEKNINEK